MSIEPQGPSADGASSRKLALVVGVDGGLPEFGQGPLKNAIDDAKDMAEVLQKEYCNFQLSRSSPLLREQATTNNVRDAIFALADDMQKGDFGLFYFSGHAMPAMDEDENVYLQTHGFAPPPPGREQFEISFKFLWENLYDHKRADNIVIILDCCFAGMFSDSALDPRLDNLLGELRKYFQMPGRNSRSPQGAGRVVLTATGRKVALERDGHGLMTLHLLKALKGGVRQAANDEGQITQYLLANYLTTALKPYNQTSQLFDAGSQVILATHPDLPYEGQQAVQQDRLQAEQLRKRFSEPDDFLIDRLEGFVGRENEIEKVHQMIAELRSQGGYLVISSEAGQGKSSLIAKLVALAAQKQDGFEKVGYHFIPPYMRIDEQGYLLRKLLIPLILKYALPLDLPENILGLNEAFQQVLKEIAQRQGQEVIFIDGLDQLVVDRNTGRRDLSFLPQPAAKLPGIVFVLGTRGIESLGLLRYLKNLQEFTLQELSSQDFISLLEHYHVTLPSSKANLLYSLTGGNTLYLSELARALRPPDKAEEETAQSSGTDPQNRDDQSGDNLSKLANALRSPDPLTDRTVEEILASIGPDPQNVFSLSIDRLSQAGELWERMSKPILRILLVAQEPLTRSQIRQMLKLIPSSRVDNEWLQRGLEHLSGLIVPGIRDIRQNDAHQRYTLKHPLLRQFLRNPFFSKEDRQEQHSYFVTWCAEEPPTLFWKPTHDEAKLERRRYARHYYITHLYHASLPETLFTVLDEGEFGRAKMLAEPSGQSYAQDLFLGQKAAIEDEAAASDALSRLWHYTFLRCSLVSRADNYPEATFRLLLRLGSEQERRALELAEMLTSPGYKKASILALIASFLAAVPGRYLEALRLVSDSRQMVEKLTDEMQKVELLRKLADTLQLLGYDQDAEQMRDKASQISQVVGLDEEGDQAATQNIVPVWLADHTRSVGFHEEPSSKGTIHSEAAATVREEAETLSPERSSQSVPHAHDNQKAKALLAVSLMLRPVAYWNSRDPIWREVEQLIRSLPDTEQKAFALAELALSAERMHLHRDAEVIRWEVIKIIAVFGDEEQRDMLLTQFMQTVEQEHYGPTIAETGKQVWKNIEATIMDFSDGRRKYKALAGLVDAFCRTGDFAGASRIISALVDERQKAEALVRLGIALVRAGNPGQPSRIVSSLSAEREKSETATTSASRQFGRWSDAVGLVNRIPTEKIRAEALAKLATGIRRAGDWSIAESVINAIPDQHEHTTALLEHAAALMEFRIFPGAEDILRSLPNDSVQCWAMARLGVAQGQAGYRREIENVLQEVKAQTEKELREAERIIRTLPDGPQKAWALAELAAVFEQAGRWEEAKDTLEQAEQIAQALSEAVREDSEFSTHWTLASVNFAIALVERKRLQQEEQVKSDVLHDDRFIAALIEQVKKPESNEDLENIERLVSRYKPKEIVSAPDSGSILRIYAHLGDAWKRRGVVKRGTSIWQAAKELIAASFSSAEQIRVLSEFARLIGETRNEEEAGQLWQESESLIGELAANQDEARVTLAMELGKAGREMDATRLLLSLENRWQKIQALASLGTQAAQIGHRKQIGQIQQDVKKLIDEVVEAELGPAVLASLKSSPEQEEDLDPEQPIDRLIEEALELWRQGRRIEAERQFQTIEKNIIPSLADESSQQEAWLLLVNARGLTGNLIEVEHLEQKFFSGRNRAQFLALYGLLLGQAGRREEARQNIASIASQPVFDPAALLLLQDQVWIKLAEVYWVKERWIDAEIEIAQIHDEHRRYETSILYAEASIQKERGQHVKHLFDRFTIARRFDALTRLGESIARSGFPSEAREICEEVEAMIRSYEHDNEEHFSQEERKRKIELFSRLGIVFEQIGDRQKAENILQEVEKDILLLFRGTHKDQALAKLANALAQAKHWQVAQEVIETIVDQTIKDGALFDLANLLIGAQRWEPARQVVLSMQDVSIKEQMFNDTSDTLAATKDEEEIQEIEQTDGEEARRIPREQMRERESSPRVIGRRVLSDLPEPPTFQASQESELTQSLQEWLEAKTVEQALERFATVCELIPRDPESGFQLWNAFKRVNTFLEALASTYASTS